MLFYKETAAKISSELVIYADLVSLLLEIINSVMTHTLHHNPQLVYALIHKKEMFIQFKSHPRFGDLIENIDIVRIIFLCFKILNAYR